MSDDEWESLKALGEADAGNLMESAMPDKNDSILDEFEGENETIGVDFNAEGV
jgi:hypothetical protein